MYKVLYYDNAKELSLSASSYKTLEEFEEISGFKGLELVTNYSTKERYKVLHYDNVGEVCLSKYKYVSLEEFESTQALKGLLLCKF